MLHKSNVTLQMKEFSFLNDVNLPFASKDFVKKASKFNNFNFTKTASKGDDDDSKEHSSLKFPEGFDLSKEIKGHPDHLYIRALAIIADEPNDNGDCFPKDELLKSYHSFVGCPLFCNHKNDDVEEARGTIVYAEWDEENNGIMIIGRVDAKAYPKLARGVSEGYITGVSMGCQVEKSECSICNNVASNADDYCEHILNNKTRSIDGKKVYENNFGIKFIELSFVVDPACDICFIQEIFDVEDVLGKVAEVSSHLQKVAKTLSNKAGKMEIDKLNQAENLIQDVAKTMLDQKQYLDLEYVSDLVDALAKLQETKDELVDMGYEQVPAGGAGAVPMGAEQPPLPEEGEFSEPFNTVTETPVGEVGEVTMPGQFASIFKQRINKSGSKNELEFNDNVKQNLIKTWFKE